MNDVKHSNVISTMTDKHKEKGAPCRLEVHAARCHVFHLQSFYLRSARDALRTLAGFARERVIALP
ncbi:hypothetical protein WL51_22665 [Burkholderia ubonensis]|uniref:Uncharacterized protein n=3 Tax=Burkholderia TaxID=32008 RepID=A0A1B4PY62_BURCE|nr:hypothetical protein WT26_22775 [Burkholderia cepacia]AOK25575.1 hypothetical protein WK67_22685 [Burkholderia ubonensis]KVO33071.1 hypothetical protein WJ74_18665 [Burkholderia ubonensis]KVU00810.1 hypothetical protein WK62_18285 [Burkholderia ubonensis]KVU08133.1 hypothetical protein WK60_22400 [Burkholderia ubonensis]